MNFRRQPKGLFKICGFFLLNELALRCISIRYIFAYCYYLDKLMLVVQQ